MIKDAMIFLNDMLYSIRRIEEMTKGMSEDGFRRGVEKQDAIIRRLSVIGEASNNLPKEVRDAHKEIEWGKIIGMRNFLIHEYFEIDLGLVWNTVKLDLPALKAKLEKMLKESDS